jgi:GNAT superfamily N-acetyltransferase
MTRLIRTDSHHPDFINLVKLLDAYLKTTDGDEHDFYNQFNNIDVLKHVVIAYHEEEAIGCGAFKEYNNSSVEIKRMYTLPKTRSQGIATKVLTALEFWAKESGYSHCILETGIRQVEAVNFYKKNSYKVIPSYGQYLNMNNSVCFKKGL